MPEYRVELGAKADVVTIVFVDAVNLKAARVKALSKAWSGNVVWEYNGADDADMMVTSAKEVKLRFGTREVR